MSNIEKIREFLNKNHLKIDEKYFKYLGDGLSELTDEDEYIHTYDEYLPNWSESFYFNFINEKSGIDLVSRISFNPYENISNILFVLFIDNKPKVYVKRIKLKGMPAKGKWDLDKRLKYVLINEHSEWRLTYEDKFHKLNITWKKRFDPFSYLAGMNILENLKKYINLIGKASQQHYEQGGIVNGTLTFKKTGEIRKIENCWAHRDHSWGTRDWKAVGKWNWISSQFEDRTINIAKVIIGNDIIVSGFISTKDGNIRVSDVEIETEFEEVEDNFGVKVQRPKTSTFNITDENGKKYLIKSKRRTSIDLPVPIPSKVKTIISEQIHNFSIDGSEYSGNGISEYLYKQ